MGTGTQDLGKLNNKMVLIKKKKKKVFYWKQGSDFMSVSQYYTDGWVQVLTERLVLLSGKVNTQCSHRFIFTIAAPHHINSLYIHNITGRAKSLWLILQLQLRFVIISETESHNISTLKTKLFSICMYTEYKWCWYILVLHINGSFQSKCRYFFWHAFCRVYVQKKLWADKWNTTTT